MSESDRLIVTELALTPEMRRAVFLHNLDVCIFRSFTTVTYSLISLDAISKGIKENRLGFLVSIFFIIGALGSLMIVGKNIRAKWCDLRAGKFLRLTGPILIHRDTKEGKHLENSSYWIQAGLERLSIDDVGAKASERLDVGSIDYLVNSKFILEVRDSSEIVKYTRKRCNGNK